MCNFAQAVRLPYITCDDDDDDDDNNNNIIFKKFKKNY